MRSLNDVLDDYLRVLEQHGSPAPKTLVGLSDLAQWAAVKFPAEITPFADLRTYFTRVNGYDRTLCDELGVLYPCLAWDMQALSIRESLQHHENAYFAQSDDNPDYWPLGFLPILWDSGGSYVVVNCEASSPTRGAVYDMCEGVGCNRIADSLQHFFAASAQEILNGLRKYSDDCSAIAVDPGTYLARAAALFGNSPYFVRVGRMDTQIVDWR